VNWNTDLASRLKRAVGTGDTIAVKRLIKGGVDINCATFWVSTNDSKDYHALRTQGTSMRELGAKSLMPLPSCDGGI